MNTQTIPTQTELVGVFCSNHLLPDETLLNNQQTFRQWGMSWSDLTHVVSDIEERWGLMLYGDVSLDDRFEALTARRG